MQNRPSHPANGAAIAREPSLNSMEAHATSAAQLLQALSNPHRLMILCALAEGETNVSELNEKLSLSQSALSQHLALLRKQQLVTTRRQSQTIYYSVTQGPAMDIVKLLHNHFCHQTNADSSN